MLGNHTFVLLDVLIVVSFNFGKSKKSHRLNLWQFSSVSKHFYIKEDLDNMGIELRPLSPTI